MEIGEEYPALNLCLPPLLPSSPLQTTCQPSQPASGSTRISFPILQLYSFRFFLVSSADQRNLLEEGLVRHTHTHVHVHTCMLFVPFHERPSIPNKGLHWQLVGKVWNTRTPPTCLQYTRGWLGLQLTYSRREQPALPKVITAKKAIQQRLSGMLKHPSRMGMAHISLFTVRCQPKQQKHHCSWLGD